MLSLVELQRILLASCKITTELETTFSACLPSGYDRLDSLYILYSQNKIFTCQTQTFVTVMNKQNLPDLWTQNRRLTFWTGADEKILFFQNTDSRFRYQRYNSYCRRQSTTKTKVFASVRNSHRTSQLAAAKHSLVLSKCWFTISHEQCNCSIVTLLQVANLGIYSIWTSFKFPNNCEIFTDLPTLTVWPWVSRFGMPAHGVTVLPLNLTVNP